MPRKPATIISDATGASMSMPASDWQDVPRHNRYYVSSAFNGGERIVETRRGPRLRLANLFGL